MYFITTIIKSYNYNNYYYYLCNVKYNMFSYYYHYYI